MAFSEDTLTTFKKSSKRCLWSSIGLDLLGAASYLLPGMGEISDGFYAPFYGMMIYYMYKENGKVPAMTGGIIGMIEEILPGTDIFPTASLMWFYVYVIKKNETLKRLQERF
jgi:hypothetical protein